MRTALKLIAAAIFVAMVVATVRASLAASIPAVWDNYAANPWAVATLWDAYCGFTIFYCWVFYKERPAGARVVWFVLIMGLGNIATSAYLLIQLFRLGDGEPAEAILLKRH